MFFPFLIVRTHINDVLDQFLDQFLMIYLIFSKNILIIAYINYIFKLYIVTKDTICFKNYCLIQINYIMTVWFNNY